MRCRCGGRWWSLPVSHQSSSVREPRLSRLSFAAAAPARPVVARSWRWQDVWCRQMDAVGPQRGGTRGISERRRRKNLSRESISRKTKRENDHRPVRAVALGCTATKTEFFCVFVVCTRNSGWSCAALPPMHHSALHICVPICRDGHAGYQPRAFHVQASPLFARSRSQSPWVKA